MFVVKVADTSVHYSVSGRSLVDRSPEGPADGPGLVLVHGASMDAATNYGHLLDRFTDTWTVVTPDYAGSGNTSAPAGELTVDLLADQVAAAALDAVAGPVDLLGFSLGAVVAARLAAREPGLVRRLVLVAGWTHTADPRLRLGLTTWRRLLDGDPTLASAVGPLLAFSPEFLSGLGPDGIGVLRSAPPAPGTREQVDLTLRVDVREDLARITAPTLVVGCTLDHLIPIRHARQLHASIPHSQYAEIDSGHVVFAEKPDELVRLVHGFLLEDSDPRFQPNVTI
jgi:pimeloyl-ACP methyl ester carboxylesterase